MSQPTPTIQFPRMTLREYYAGLAMQVVMQETQEMRIASFWDWIKMLLMMYLHFSFLTIKYVKVENVYEDGAVRAVEYADALIAELDKNKGDDSK